MSDTKWADVAHYYTKSGIDAQKTFSPDFLTSGIGRRIMATNGGIHPFDYNRWDFWSKGHSDQHILSMVPILRHRDDMTEAEARELWEIQIGEPWVQDTDETAIQCLFFNIGNSQMEMADNATFLSVLVGEPKAWNYLISRGFDLFGLIESGQAIRKEMGNG